MNQRSSHVPKQHARTVIATTLATTLMAFSPAWAVQLEMDNPDVTVRWDNTVRVNMGVRAGAPDSRIVNNPNYQISPKNLPEVDLSTEAIVGRETVR